VRPQPIPGKLTLAIGEFRQIGFTGEITLAGNAGDEAIGGLQPVTSPGEFVAQMLRAIGPGILLTVANEADVRRLDKTNQFIDFRLCLRIQSQRDRSRKEEDQDGRENLAQVVDVAILARCSEQTLDREPTQHLGLDAVPKTGFGLGVVAHVLVTLARYSCKAIAVKLHVIPVRVQIAFGGFGQTLHQRTVEENTHLCIQFPRARIEVVGADKANSAVEGERLRMQTRTGLRSVRKSLRRSPNSSRLAC
jgi:hypothetical protein